MKCEICKEKVQETFLGKIIGGIVKDAKGKKRTVCNNCQKKFRTKEEILSHI
ncbi:hypothetical protein HY638_02070 [Candidatus Woesearchaeota archaeon]|nr:hypothetical protein [Candidatus Woesearchaeota archaeon]